MIKFPILLTLSLIPLLQTVLIAQEMDATVESEIRRLPWVEPDSIGKEVIFKDLSDRIPSEARTKDRAGVPLRAKNQKTQTTTAPRNTPRDLSWVQTLIWIVITIVIVAIVVAFIWIFLKMEHSSTDSHSPSAVEEDLGERVKQLPFQLEGELDGDFRSQAAAAAQRGNFGRATMLLFSHVLISLDQRRLIKLKKGKTNRQYLVELGSYRKLKLYFEEVMIPFEDHFFGSHKIDQQRFHKYWNNLDQFLNDVEEASKAVVL